MDEYMIGKSDTTKAHNRRRFRVLYLSKETRQDGCTPNALWLAVVREVTVLMDMCGKAEALNCRGGSGGLYKAGAFGSVLERVQGITRGIDGTRASLLWAARVLRNTTTAMQVAVEHGRKDSAEPNTMMGARPNTARAGRAAQRQKRQAEERMRQVRMGPVEAPGRDDRNGVGVGAREHGGCADATEVYSTMPWGDVDEMLAQPERFMAADMGQMPDKYSAAAARQYAELTEWMIDELEALGLQDTLNDRYDVTEPDDRDLFRKAASIGEPAAARRGAVGARAFVDAVSRRKGGSSRAISASSSARSTLGRSPGARGLGHSKSKDIDK